LLQDSYFIDILDNDVNASINTAFANHFRCPEEFVDFGVREPLTSKAESFRFGTDIHCHGRRWIPEHSDNENHRLEDAFKDVQLQGTKCLLPFDPTDVIENLRRERYLPPDVHSGAYRGLVRGAYYAVRPVLPVALRKHMQRRRLRGWERRTFPSWPVDRTVDKLFEKLMLLALSARERTSMPFIWFWPEGRPGCITMTHDVETETGLQSCDALMALDSLFGIRSSFQIIPGGRYKVSPEVLDKIRSRGFEVDIHDWNHDGSLFRDRKTFLKRAVKINQSAAQWKTRGFRSAVLYRNTDWYDSLDFDFDMSVPNVGHLDPQPGGCCTIMPYFIGKILEIPVTMTQDYSLFHILKDYSIELWKRQLDIILHGNGLASFIIHPDYIFENRAAETYKLLLEHLRELASEKKMWIALPQAVNQWWRDRSQMRLVRKGERWSIEGPGSERARIAHARIHNRELIYTFD
jgi:hypothetical protein